jgi:hypothetical protein
VSFFVGAAPSSNVYRIDTPASGVWSTPFTTRGMATPQHSRMVGTMSVTWWYWSRTCPRDDAAMPAGQWTTSGSHTPPWYEYRLNMRNGVENAMAQPVG